jgi:murein DD-endopeptidase MepM/ murein hydrolase activator NlpD
MSKLNIDVAASFDASGVEQQINTMGQKVAQANKVQFNPVSVKSIQQVQAMEKQFQQLLKVHGELSRRMKATGQEGRGFSGTDFDQIFPDQNARARQLRKIMEYTLGQGVFSSAPGGGGGGGRPPPPAPPAPPGGGSGGGGGMSMIVGAARAGLGAAGPVGGVASNALGTGMSAGFGAGMMGLLGGMLALGVGKIVSGVMEKVSQAEDNSVALDRLKRTLGDVNVSFGGLKAVVNGGAEAMKITYAEAGKLGQQFAQLGNVKGSEYTSLADELGVGVGLSRSFGLDPEQGVGVMGQMRGIGVTRTTQDSKRFALLIGETIGKSDAFAKSGEVMEALAGFAQSQTRQNMGAANVSGYAGAFSALVGSGIPGLDPSGAGSLLGRINAALSGGGAKGEASQYFTGMIGMGMGLNPYQTRMLREGGAFATNDSMFGEGSAYARYKGLKPGDARPGGGTTFLQASIDRLRTQYGDGSDELADATANHLGIGINQAMALLSVKPNQMGGMSKYANLTSLSGSGIGNLSKVLYGGASERQGVADSLMRRSDVTDAEKSSIKVAMAGGDVETQKRVLAEIVAQRDQEQTQGKDIRDSKNALDNIKTNLADKLVPVMNEMRHGIMYIAGAKDGKSPQDIMRAVMSAESKGNIDSINGRISSKLTPLQERADFLRNKERSLNAANLQHTYRDKPEILAEKLREREAVLSELKETERKIAALESEKASLLKEENDKLAEKIRQTRDPEIIGSITPAPLAANANQSPAEVARLSGAGRGRVTSGFGMRIHPITGRLTHHDGIDFGASAGTAIKASADGEVTRSEASSGGYGNVIEIRHADGTVTRYGHNRANNVKVGQSVRAGETIGEVGSTGNSTGPHLHYEMIKGGRAVDPQAALASGQHLNPITGTVQVEVVVKKDSPAGPEIGRQTGTAKVQNNWRPPAGGN